MSSLVINIDSGEKREYELLSEGLHQAVLADIEDLGMLPTQWGDKHKIRFVWLTDEADSKGFTKRAFDKFTFSLNEKATLYKVLKQMKIKLPAKGQFDVASLLGRQQGIVVQHSEPKEGTGKTYANIVSYMAPNPTATIRIPADFKRKVAAPAVAGAKTSASDPGPITDDDIPF